MEDVDLGEPLAVAEIGKARVLVEGSDITMVAWGRQVRSLHVGCRCLAHRQSCWAEICNSNGRTCISSCSVAMMNIAVVVRVTVIRGQWGCCYQVQW